MATREELEQKYGEPKITELRTRGNNGDINATRQLAEWGLAPAQLLMGNHFRRVDNMGEAIRWWEMAAIQGYADAMWNLGTVFRLGGDVPKNHDRAIQWYKVATDKQHTDAKLHLGIYYCWGEHIAQDLQKGKCFIDEALREKISSGEDFDPMTYLELGALFYNSKISEKGNMPSVRDTEKCVAYLEKALTGYKALGFSDPVKLAGEMLASAKEKLRLMKELA